jgi:putative endonuclease
MKTYYVYIMGNKAPTLYTGVTNNLERRVLEHRRKLVPGFTTRYNIDRLVYYETFREVRSAINREKRVARTSVLEVRGSYLAVPGNAMGGQEPQTAKPVVCATGSLAMLRMTWEATSR